MMEHGDDFDAGEGRGAGVEGTTPIPKVMVVSALDPSGGAGLLMDSQAAGRAGSEPACALTGIAVQDSKGVSSLVPISSEDLRAQMVNIVERARPRAAKCGALLSGDNARAVAGIVASHDLIAVVDPVTSSSSGGSLACDASVDRAIVEGLLPETFLLTPNLPEARRLAGMMDDGEDGDEGGGSGSDDGGNGIVELCRRLTATGCRAVLIKGGHGGGGGGPPPGDVVDHLFIRGDDGGEPLVRRFIRSRSSTSPHGTGCALSSLIAGRLAAVLAGRDGPEAKDALTASVLWAEAVLGRWLRSSAPLPGDAGAVHMNPSHNSDVGRSSFDRFPPPFSAIIPSGTEAVSKMTDEYLSAMAGLMAVLPVRLIPEVGTNMSYALPGAETPEEVLALDSRAVRVGGDGICTSGEVEAGGSHHTARIVLAAMHFDGDCRCAINLRYRPAGVEACRAAGLSVSSFSRADEPSGGSTMEWGTRAAISARGGSVPDVVYDEGGMGKEPMMRVMGRNPAEVFSKVKRILGSLKGPL